MTPGKILAEIHLIVVISLSMIITFGLHCGGMSDLLPRDSAFQRFAVDFLRDLVLFLRCSDYDGRRDQICSSLLLPEDFILALLIIVVLCLIVVLTLSYTSKIRDHFRLALVILWSVELLGRCLDFHKISDQIDVVIVYFVVWQLISVMWAWMLHYLPSPILLIEQASLCIFMSAVAFVYHYSAFRYVPREILVLTSSRLAIQSDCPGFYYTGIDGEWRGAYLGFGDFLSYNLMVLFALPPSPSSSITTQLWITVGSMISIAIGYSATIWLRRTYQLRRVPGVPLPVVTYTAYVLLLDAI